MHPSISSLTFGAEFEVILPSDRNRASAASAVAAHSGLTVVSAVLGGRPVTTWKVVSDASVSGGGAGLEFVSPVLKGADGLEQVRKICAALTSIGATVNTTCGFHVHVGARDQADNPEFFKNLLKLYGKFEEALDGIMPASRRGNANRYCASIVRYAPNVDRARSVQEVIGTIPGRYHKLNLAAFKKHRTVEFRQHAGTVDGEKAVNWIVVCLKLVAAAKAGKTGAGPAIARDFSRLDAKARAVADAISKPEGATAEEIRAANGFRALSVKRQVAIAGLQVRVVKERGKERFFLVAQTDPGRTVPSTLEGLFEVIDASPEEAAFLRSRAQRLA
ncbi:amidoligase family protein [Bradyrhizobium sp. BRP22]|uniref:amidoligase family protein n=1 Tax=Bradyrhizobium sp. BRP22 TaxID=2793821 RepID=UPI001CD1E0A4|nr:amidoligase family protein [Bradyrhizobium sp. BRP22]